MPPKIRELIDRLKKSGFIAWQDPKDGAQSTMNDLQKACDFLNNLQPSA
jgi:hypothetical protein